MLAASYSSNAGTLPGRLFVLAIDQGNMTKGGGRGAMEAVGRFLDKLTPADRVALITLPAGPAVEFTSDHALVKAAAGKVVGGGANRYDGSYFRTLSLGESFAFVTGSQRRLFNEAVSEECSFARTSEEADPLPHRHGERGPQQGHDGARGRTGHRLRAPGAVRPAGRPSTARSTSSSSGRAS